jgi:hypothetical protein
VRFSSGMVVLVSACTLCACGVQHEVSTSIAPLRHHEVPIPDRLARALKASAPGFQTFVWADFDTAITNPDVGWNPPFDSTRSPSTVIADLDGDGHPDVAVLQRSAGERRFAVVLDREPTPQVVELERWPDSPESRHAPLQEFLMRADAGPIELPNWDTGDPDTTIQVPHGGVEYVIWEKASELYYYENGKFKSVTTSD